MIVPSMCSSRVGASLQLPVADYPAAVVEHWERLEPWRDLSPLWKRWLRIYALRVEVQVALERLIVWPDLACEGVPEVFGAPLASEPPQAQDPPRRGTGSRIDQARVARAAGRLPDVLLGWVGSDGFPMALPVRLSGSDEQGILLEAPGGIVPAGGRRAGLTAHWFSRGVVGQRQSIHTGWLQAGADGARLIYSPHTRAAYRMPSSRLVYRIVTGLFTRLRYRQARRAGIEQF